MGMSDLRELAIIETTSMTQLRGSVVAVDAHNWLYRYLTIAVRYRDESAYTTTDGAEVPNLLGIIQGVPKFLEHGILPVFVFDGMVLDLKADEMQERRQRKREAADRARELRERGQTVEAAKYAARAQRLTDVILETTTALFDRLDVPFIYAPADAEAQAAFMAKRRDVDYVGSEDYDTLLFGAPYTLRKLTASESPELMDLAATLAEHDITQEQLVDIAILCGTDYNDGIYGYGPKTALGTIREYGSLDAAMADGDFAIDNLDTLRSIFLDPTVTGEYSIPRRIDPDLDRAYRFVVDEWEIPGSDLERAFDRWETATPFVLD